MQLWAYFVWLITMLNLKSALSAQTHSPLCVERFHDCKILKDWRRRRQKCPSEDIWRILCHYAPSILAPAERKWGPSYVAWNGKILDQQAGKLK